LGAALGLNKDTAAAAVRRLKAAGLVCGERQQHAATGTFSSGSYLLDRTALTGVLSVAGRPPRATAATRPDRRRVGQATLFAAEPSA
jgi:hypothetical protein